MSEVNAITRKQRRESFRDELLILLTKAFYLMQSNWRTHRILALAKSFRKWYSFSISNLRTTTLSVVQECSAIEVAGNEWTSLKFQHN
jgi:hypothetical protein